MSTKLQTKKEKGDVLENIVHDLCLNIKNAKITKKAKIMGINSNSPREIDVLIDGCFDKFPIRIIVECKNYKNPVGIEKIESLKTKLSDVNGTLGVFVCPNGFTEPAKEAAKTYGIELFEIYDKRLENCDLFLPVRLVMARIKNFAFDFTHRVIGSFEMTTDQSRWRFKINNKIFNQRELVEYSWNDGKIKQISGEQVIDFGAVVFIDIDNSTNVQYLELKIIVNVVEDYYLKLFPFSFMKNVKDGNKQVDLKIDIHQNDDLMIKNGWAKFETLEEMNKVANIEKQTEDIKNLIIRAEYKLNV